MRKLSLNLFAETYDRKAAHLKNAVGCVFPPGNCAYMGPRNAYYHFFLGGGPGMAFPCVPAHFNHWLPLVPQATNVE